MEVEGEGRTDERGRNPVGKVWRLELPRGASRTVIISLGGTEGLAKAGCCWESWHLVGDLSLRTGALWTSSRTQELPLDISEDGWRLEGEDCVRIKPWLSLRENK